MRHDETRARHEARAEAFEEAAALLDERRAHHERLLPDRMAAGAAGTLDLSAMDFRALAARERAASARKPPVRYTEAPETERASGGAWSAREGLGSYPFEAMDQWPGEDGGRGGA
jgi:hypothetical protein